MEDTAPLANWTIFRFYYPLAVSWLFMGLEGPVCEGVVNRMGHPEVNAAAWPILMAIAIWIESPVIDLLSTSTTLAKSKTSYEVISRFVWYLLTWVTVAHAIIVLSPIYNWVCLDLLGVKSVVADAARPGLVILIPWAALIGWRRYLQGILIRHGETRAISWGTTARVIALVLTAVWLYRSSRLPSVVIASIAVMVGVFTEAAFVHWISREVIAKYLSERRADDDRLTMRKLAAFHLPLSATTMVNLLVMPMVNAGIARTDKPVLALAGCGVAGAVLFLNRAVTFCLPEVVITLYKNEKRLPKLRNFSIGAGLISSGLILFLGVTNFDRYIFSWLIDANLSISQVAHQTYLLCTAIPVVDAAQAYVRGVLTAHHMTVSRLVAVCSAIFVLIGLVILGVALRWSGPVLMATSVTGGLLAELLVLYFAWSRSRAAVPALATN